MKQKLEAEKRRLEVIKESKLNELLNLNINQKYVTDLQKYKIK